tara:strand:- start:160 stop:294 length:135 start_codon:yes stop_codon:yes gene_type:complete
MSAIFTAAIFATIRARMVECPNHGGAFDCTPFCPLCEGNQEAVK